MSASHIVGIDLGTSNCAVAFASLADGPGARVNDFPVVQVQRPGEVAARALLPSTLYVPGEHELPAGSAALPWESAPALIAGEFARWQGARVPGRLVASAKSWLCHTRIDRTAASLPWGAPAGVRRVSPVDAQALLLGHLVGAWNHAHPGAPLPEQEVVITVPASFDEGARALTVEAARRAGLERCALVEEPQAAFQAFAARHRESLAEALDGVRRVLVVDVGGGTSDFSLIEVSPGPDGPVLRRIAVGDHLMLGGDNMDAALARRAEERLTAAGRKLGASQWSQLVQVTRAAKEVLLAADAPERCAVAVAAEGSRLIGGTLSTELPRDETCALVLDGFLPPCGLDETPRATARTALQELGLPYAQDPAITRHLAAFLRRHAGPAADQPGGTGEPAGRPDAILLNGGVFKAACLGERLLAIVSGWWPGAPPIRLLPHDSLDLAVARGAAWHGLARRGIGRRIGGGSAHAVYIGVAAGSGPDRPRALCLIPRGHEEGTTVDLPGQPLALALGRPVQFPLYSTADDRTDRPGDVVAAGDDLRPLPPMHTLLKGAAAGAATASVHLRATLTELGTLELWCVSNERDERWRLEFELRGGLAAAGSSVTESMPEKLGEVRAVVDRAFGRKPQPVGPRDVKDLVRTMEAAIGGRERWSLPLLRELWGAVLAGADKRRRSADHERVFLQLLGWCLRPGFGYPLDEWRCERTFELFAGGVAFQADHKVWREFWVLWRRAAGGLDEARQRTIWDWMRPHLARRVPLKSGRNAPRPKGAQPEGLDEMVRAAASLELLPTGEKALFGGWLLERVHDPESTGGPWAWALGRIGARVPLHASGHLTIDAETATAWLDALVARGLSMSDGTAFAAVQLARRTGDRARDLDDDARERTAAALAAAQAPDRWQQLVREVVALDTADQTRALGDSLPVGLALGG